MSDDYLDLIRAETQRAMRLSEQAAEGTLDGRPVPSFEGDLSGAIRAAFQDHAQRLAHIANLIDGLPSIDSISHGQAIAEEFFKNPVQRGQRVTYKNDDPQNPAFPEVRSGPKTT